MEEELTDPIAEIAALQRQYSPRPKAGARRGLWRRLVALSMATALAGTFVAMAAALYVYTGPPGTGPQNAQAKPLPPATGTVAEPRPAVPAPGGELFPHVRAR